MSENVMIGGRVFHLEATMPLEVAIRPKDYQTFTWWEGASPSDDDQPIPCEGRILWCPADMAFDVRTHLSSIGFQMCQMMSLRGVGTIPNFFVLMSTSLHRCYMKGEFRTIW